MATTLYKIVEQAMGLPSDSRAQLADLLVQSLDSDGLGYVERIWVDEAKRRRDEVRNGKVDTIPGETALRKTRESLRR